VLVLQLFLRRPPGWPDEIARLIETLGPGPQTAPRSDAPDRRLVAQLGELRTQQAEQRDEHRRQVKALKEEITALRASVKAERDRAAAAEGERAKLADDLATVRAAAATAERRLQQKLSEATDALAEARRIRRSERGDDTTRLRLLVDTLTGVATGLRRELALPSGPPGALPADGVEMREPGDAGTAGSRSLADAGGRGLNEHLTLPQAHLIVDAYNVTMTAWPTATLADQRARLTTALSGLQARTLAEITAVFDGADLRVVPAAAQARGVRVRFSPPGVSADDVIRELVAAEPAGRPVIVVTSDNAVATDVARTGATVFGSPALVELIDRT
jgi:predicted RNA-binding protein with PIN domain